MKALQKNSSSCQGATPGVGGHAATEATAEWADGSKLGRDGLGQTPASPEAVRTALAVPGSQGEVSEWRVPGPVPAHAARIHLRHRQGMSSKRVRSRSSLGWEMTAQWGWEQETDPGSLQGGHPGAMDTRCVLAVTAGWSGALCTGHTVQKGTPPRANVCVNYSPIT